MQHNWKSDPDPYEADRKGDALLRGAADDRRKAEEAELEAALGSTSSTCRVERCEILPQLAAARGTTVQELSLKNPGDGDLRSLAGFRSLTKLVLDDAWSITDDGLKALGTLATLKELTLPSPTCNKRITPAGVAVLRKALPNCQITGGPQRPWWRFW